MTERSKGHIPVAQCCGWASAWAPGCSGACARCAACPAGCAGTPEHHSACHRSRPLRTKPHTAGTCRGLLLRCYSTQLGVVAHTTDTACVNARCLASSSAHLSGDRLEPDTMVCNAHRSSANASAQQAAFVALGGSNASACARVHCSCSSSWQRYSHSPMPATAVSAGTQQQRLAPECTCRCCTLCCWSSGMAARHCSTALAKQVLPRLCRPTPCTCRQVASFEGLHTCQAQPHAWPVSC